MKPRSRITRIQLDDNTEEEYAFLAIVSTEADYKLSQLISNKLRIELKNNTKQDLAGVNGINMNFTRYSDTTQSPEKSFDLISNRSDKNYLLKKFKNIDYFLLVHSSDKKYDIEQLTASLREIERITAVFKLDGSDIKDLNLLHLTL